MTSNLKSEQALTFLRETYPQAFRQPGDIKPLEVGIHREIVRENKLLLQKKGITTSAVYTALYYYCASKEYRKARKTLGNARINLAGEVVGEVTLAEVELSKKSDAKFFQERKKTGTKPANSSHKKAKPTHLKTDKK
jgi:sRNA-binding protein